MQALLHIHWAPLISSYGYWLVFLVVAMESTGIPLPGETMLISAAIYAGQTHQLNIFLIVACAATAAILGDNCGYWIGREAGMPLLRRYGHYVGLDQNRLRLGQYVFMRHGGKIVFFGRFIAVLRALAAVLAGANGFAWPRFLLFNAAGGIGWAALFGFGGYAFGRAIHRIAGPLGLGLLVIALAAIAFGWVFMRRHEAELQARADAALGAKGG
ncbi:MAG TPA: DedA family protein [Beijerinckiaceae bacterium]|nr:DedA family protein [Beijerinckiaceae bacterium]